MVVEVRVSESGSKSAIRKLLRARIQALSPEARHRKSQEACGLLIHSPEFAQARIVMLYLAMPLEVDTAPVALRCWQDNKTVVVPKVSWDQRRMLPVEITSLTNGLTSTRHGLLEPIAGNPIPINLIDLAIVPGIGFSPQGYRIGRGMGFYDRFLAQGEFMGTSCGLAFDEQVVDDIPVLDHDVALSMLVTDRGIRRFTPNLIQS
jgi:5-formyltetrahydrofolate cyclo-ligase